MADGRVVPAQSSFNRAPVVKKLLIVLPYYTGDKEDAESLALLICDLERVRIKDADIMIMGRWDAMPFSQSVMSKLGERFDKVHMHTCRRKDGVGHPFGCNQMFFDVVTLLGQQPVWARDYYAFLFLEPDVVPTRPGWIGELGAAFKVAQETQGKVALGFIHNNPVAHLNGVAVYDIDFYHKFAGDTMGGGRPRFAFDIDKANFILPVAQDSPLFYFEYKRPTITAGELFSPRRSNVVPALWHGVKDASARDAVRARHVNFTDKPSGARPNVYTYFHPVHLAQEAESRAILALWSEAWRGRGFNPVVLKQTDAIKNAHFSAFVEAVKLFPTVLDKQAQVNRFLRWMALDSSGGGLLVDYDVLPSKATPDVLGKMTGFHLARPRVVPSMAEGSNGSGRLAMAFVDKPSLSRWLDRIQNYNPSPDDKIGDRASVSDVNVMAKTALDDGIIPEEWIENFGQPGWMNGLAVHFMAQAIQVTPARAEKKSALMEKFLRGDTESWAKPAPLTSAPNSAPEGTPLAANSPAIPSAIEKRAPVDLSDLQDEVHQEAAPAPNEREDAARELFVENEKLAAENEGLKKRMADLEAKFEQMVNAPKAGGPTAEQIDGAAPKKNKGGRPKKVKPETAGASA
jgi:hypothetical protein